MQLSTKIKLLTITSFILGQLFTYAIMQKEINSRLCLINEHVAEYVTGDK